MYENGTVWLTQSQLCELYQNSKSNTSEHIQHIFEEEELEENSVVRKFRTTGADGKNIIQSINLSCGVCCIDVKDYEVDGYIRSCKGVVLDE